MGTYESARTEMTKMDNQPLPFWSKDQTTVRLNAAILPNNKITAHCDPNIGKLPSNRCR